MLQKLLRVISAYTGWKNLEPNGPQTAFILTYTGVLKLIIKGREVVIYMWERVKVLLVILNRSAYNLLKHLSFCSKDNF